MQPKGNLPMMKPDDMQYFDKLLVSVIALVLKFYYVSPLMNAGITFYLFILLNFALNMIS